MGSTQAEKNWVCPRCFTSSAVLVNLSDSTSPWFWSEHCIPQRHSMKIKLDMLHNISKQHLIPNFCSFPLFTYLPQLFDRGIKEGNYKLLLKLEIISTYVCFIRSKSWRPSTWNVIISPRNTYRLVHIIGIQGKLCFPPGSRWMET